MFGAVKSVDSHILVVNVDAKLKPKKTAAALQSFLAAALVFSFPDVFFHSREFGNGCSDSRDSRAPGND